MRLLIGLLEQSLPPGAPEDLEAAEAWRPWKVKKLTLTLTLTATLTLTLTP